MLIRWFARPLGTVVALFALGSMAARPATAQSGSSVDIITGTVTDGTGKGVAGAIIEAYSIENQVTKKTTSNDKGRYTIFFNDGTGQYRVTVRQIGKQPFIQNVTRQTDDDRIVLNIKMGDKPVVLQDITARAGRQPTTGANDRPTPGSTERNISADQAAKLPIDASDLAALAALAPGVVMTSGTDSTGAAFSVAGQATSQNSFVVDGSSMGGGNSSVPQDAIRSTRVITNTYDVGRGQFSGGQVSATTRGGSNVKQGSATLNIQSRGLAFGAGSGDAFSSGQNSQQIGGGFGGPLKKDKFFLYGAFQLNHSVQPITSLDAADQTTLERLGASPDSVTRFNTLVDATGLTARAGYIDPNRGTDRVTGTVRFDWNAADRHTVTVRGDLNLNGSDPTRIGSTQLSQVGGLQTGNGGGVQVSVASRFGTNLTNELRVYGSTNNAATDGYLIATPAGRVQNFSTLADSTSSTNVFGFGGNSGLPQSNDARALELTEELSFLPAGGSHRLRLGLLLNSSTFTQDATTNRYGTFAFYSLADFEANKPASYTRTLEPTITTGGAVNTAAYLSDVWRPSQNLQLTLGGRLEHSDFSGAPARNEAVEAAFGVRTDILPTETYFTPRLGFSLTIPSGEQQGQGQRGFSPPKLVIRGGAGVFRGTMPATLAGTAQSQAGFLYTERQLSCVGDNVPVPDWSGFAADPSTIPTRCTADGVLPSLGRPTVTAYDATYAAAKTVRGSIGFTRRFWNTWSFNFDASYVRGIGQSATRDLNLNTTAQFTIAGEANRPVYADPTQIITTTGAIPLTASRQNAAFGNVNSFFSTLENETKQMTAGISAFTRRGALINFNYTLMYAQDEGGSGGGGGFGGGGGGNNTAGDPNVYLWARSSSDRRHNFQVNVTWPFNQGLEMTAIGSMVSGTPYTPLVGGDINGDGSRNDRAYIFDPSTSSDPDAAAAFTNLLATTSNSGRTCLESQLGTIAARNSCRGPWTPAFSLQVNWRPATLQRRMTVSFATVNLLGGLDELFHGADGIKGWGGNARPDATLLTVRGFDATTNQFKYVVNDRFGATSAAATSIRAPFQLRVTGRYTIGQAQGRDAMRGGFGGGGGAGGAGAAGGASFAQQFLTRIRDAAPNPAKAALERKDSLALTPDQITQLQAIVDSGDARITPLLTDFEAELKKAGTNPDFAALMPKLRPIMDAITKEQTTDRAKAKAILTDVQWALLPEAVRNPQGVFGGQRGPGAQPGAGGGRGPDRP